MVQKHSFLIRSFPGARDAPPPPPLASLLFCFLCLVIGFSGGFAFASGQSSAFQSIIKQIYSAQLITFLKEEDLRKHCRQPINPSTRQRINLNSPPINPSTHQPVNELTLDVHDRV